MGRAFEFRKGRKMKRWAAMAKTFTRIGKDIVMAVKEGGPNPEANSRLRAVIQNSKAANMPKENVERAIKKAIDKDTANYKEVLFEGYAPHGIAILVETATDNNNRTVANIRSYFNKCNGTFGTQGSVEFMFDHTCNFRIPAEGQDVEELELELIGIIKKRKKSNNCFNLIIPFVMNIAVATLGNVHANLSLRSGRNYRLSKC